MNLDSLDDPFRAVHFDSVFFNVHFWFSLDLTDLNQSCLIRPQYPRLGIGVGIHQNPAFRLEVKSGWGAAEVDQNQNSACSSDR